MAARSIWSGSVSFGLVNVPVKLFTATSPKTVRFNQLNSDTGARIRQLRVDPTLPEGKQEVAYEKIIKGFEISPGRYVTVTSEELEAIAPKQTKTIGVEEFVDLAEIDPLAYDATYYVGPADESAGTVKAYRLLAQAMHQGGKVGIGRIILRSKESLAALRVNDRGVLMVSTLLFADELLAPERAVDLDQAGEVEPSPQEVAMAEALMGALQKPWDHAAWRDTYREKVLEMVQAKAAGEAIAAPAQTEEPAASPDLMAALKASLAAASADGAPEVAPAKVPAKRSRKKVEVAS